MTVKCHKQATSLNKNPYIGNTIFQTSYKPHFLCFCNEIHSDQHRNLKSVLRKIDFQNKIYPKNLFKPNASFQKGET